MCPRPTYLPIILLLNCIWNLSIAATGQLHLVGFTSCCVEGKFSNGRSGIRFKSEGTVNGLTLSYIAITDLEGRNVFSSFLLDERTTVMSAMGGDYLIVKGSALSRGQGLLGTAYYRIHQNARTLVIRSLLSGYSPRYLLNANYLQDWDVEASSRKDFWALLNSEEAPLIYQAALELGKRGLYGIDSAGGMIFYTLAMRLANYLFPTAVENTGTMGGTNCSNTFRSAMRERYLPAPAGYQLCENNWQYCEQCPQGPSCTGVCGVGCQCWKMVCGDCCYHHGCSGHGQCGCMGSTVSFSCFNVFGFKCDSTYSCTALR